MRRLVEEVSYDGLESLLGEYIDVWCVNYIYTGKLIGVNNEEIKLDEAKIVYETGELTSNNWKDAQSIPNSRYIRLSAIESYGKTNKIS